MDGDPGTYGGKPYTDYVEEVKALKRSGDLSPGADLLLHLIDAVEAEAAAHDW